MNKNLFEKLKDKLLEIYSNEESSRFDVGKIIAADEEWMVFSIYDNYGSNDGFMLLRADTVFKIDYNTIYLKDLEPLVDCALKIDFKNTGDLYSDFIKKFACDKLVFIVLSNGSSVTGKITEKLDRYLRVAQYLENGLNDGETILLEDCITCIQCDTQECKKIRKNIEARKGNDTN